MARFVTNRGFRFINGINYELLDRVIETPVIIYKVAPGETRLNLYGEAVAGSTSYYVGVQVSARVEDQERQSNHEGFGQDVGQNVNFYFQREKLKDLNILPQHGDIIKWNDAYYEIDNFPGAERFGGQVDFKVSIRCETHMTRRSRINIEERVL